MHFIQDFHKEFIIILGWRRFVRSSRSISVARVIKPISSYRHSSDGLIAHVVVSCKTLASELLSKHPPNILIVLHQWLFVKRQIQTPRYTQKAILKAAVPPFFGWSDWIFQTSPQKQSPFLPPYDPRDMSNASKFYFKQFTNVFCWHVIIQLILTWWNHKSYNTYPPIIRRRPAAGRKWFRPPSTKQSYTTEAANKNCDGGCQIRSCMTFIFAVELLSFWLNCNLWIYHQMTQEEISSDIIQPIYCTSEQAAMSLSLDIIEEFLPSLHNPAYSFKTFKSLLKDPSGRTQPSTT